MVGGFILQVYKNPWPPPSWMQHRFLDVLSLFCQPILGVHVSQNQLRTHTPTIQVILVCRSLWWPRACHMLHQNNGGPYSSPLIPDLISLVQPIMAAAIFKTSSCSKRHTSLAFDPTNWIDKHNTHPTVSRLITSHIFRWVLLFWFFFSLQCLYQMFGYS